MRTGERVYRDRGSINRVWGSSAIVRFKWASLQGDFLLQGTWRPKFWPRRRGINYILGTQIPKFRSTFLSIKSFFMLVTLTVKSSVLSKCSISN